MTQIWQLLNVDLFINNIKCTFPNKKHQKGSSGLIGLLFSIVVRFDLLGCFCSIHSSWMVCVWDRSLTALFHLTVSQKSLTVLDFLRFYNKSWIKQRFIWYRWGSCQGKLRDQAAVFIHLDSFTMEYGNTTVNQTICWEYYSFGQIDLIFWTHLSTDNGFCELLSVPKLPLVHHLRTPLTVMAASDALNAGLMQT